MKAILILAFSLACSAAALRADACCEEKPVSAEQRMREIDLKIALKQYEQVRVELAKTQLALMLAETDETAAPEAREKQLAILEKRSDRLREYSERIRKQVLELEQAIQLASK